MPNRNAKASRSKVVPEPFNRQAGAARQFKTPVAQLKSPASAQSIKRPVAPPVYRPQPVPKVLQTKSSSSSNPPPGQSRRQPVAPPVYRPQAKKIVQPKAVSPQRQLPGPPRVHRPEQSRVAQQHSVIQRSKDPVKEWIEDVQAIASAHSQIGPQAGLPQEYNRIEKGPFRGPHKGPDEVLARPHMDPVSVAFGMTREEETALYKYSQGRKNKSDSPGYMERDEWEALGSAVLKIPSMGALGKVATVFRGERTSHFTHLLRKRIGKPCYIVHGCTKTAAGVYHLASAAFTVNSHAMKARVLVRIICCSARYIQYWGMHGASLDGGEVLIPALTITYYDGEPPHIERFGIPMEEEGRSLRLGKRLPSPLKEIFTLVEVDPQDVNQTLPFFDDFKGDFVDGDILRRILPPKPAPVHPTAPWWREKID